MCVRIPGTGGSNEQLKENNAGQRNQWGCTWRDEQDKPGLLAVAGVRCYPHRHHSTGAPGGCLPREVEGWGPQRRDGATKGKEEGGAAQRTSSPPTFQDRDFSLACGFYAGPAQTHRSWHSWGFVPLCCGGPVTVWIVSHPPAHPLMGVRWNTEELGKSVWGKQAAGRPSPMCGFHPYRRHFMSCPPGVRGLLHDP